MILTICFVVSAKELELLIILQPLGITKGEFLRDLSFLSLNLISSKIFRYIDFSPLSINCLYLLLALIFISTSIYSLRRALLHLGQPNNMILGMKCLYRTVDEIWFVSGDTSTDFNFYSKRGLLAAVYSSTILFWLDDKSDDCKETWSFLNRRIDDVLKIPKMTSKLSNLSSPHVPNPSRLISQIREQFLEGRRF